MKKFISLLLCLLMIIPQAAIGSLATEPVVLESIEVTETVPLIVERDGFWNLSSYDSGKEQLWFEYEVIDAVGKVKLNYSDGTYEEISVDDRDGFGTGSDQGYANAWTVGNTYTAVLYYEDFWCEYDVYIAPSGVKSIEIVELETITEGISGGFKYYSLDSNWDGIPEEAGYYYNYYPSEFIKTLKINYEDGSSQTVGREEIQSDYYIETDQGLNNEWQAGETHTVKLYYSGATCEFDVYIEPNNVDRIEIVDQKPLIEGVDCYENSEYVDGEWKYYDYYYPYHAIGSEELRVYYDDGTSEIIKLYHYSEEQFKIITEQSYYKPWLPGGSYPVTMKFMGVEIRFDVSIVADPVVSIEVYEHQEVVEGQSGYYTESYSSETKDYDKFFYYPDWALVNTIKINYADGTYKIVAVEDLDNWYIQNDQYCDSYWIGGNTYRSTFVYGKYSCDFDVYIIPNNIDHIEAYETRWLIEGVNCWENEDIVDDEWVKFVEYDANEAVESIRVFYKDGTHEILDADNVSFTVDTHQTPTDVWSVGNTYPATLLYGGKRCDFEISLIEDPVVSYEVYESRNIKEGIDGGFSTQYNEATGEYTTYYYYDPMHFIDSFKVNYVDGSYEIIAAEDFEFEQWSYDQSFENQWVGGNSYEVRFVKDGREFTHEIYVESFLIDSVEVVEIAPLSELVDGSYNEVDGEAFFEYNPAWSIKTVQINYADGTSDICDWDHFNELYGTYIEHDQGVDNQWMPGNTYTATLIVGSKRSQFEVEIAENPIESIVINEGRPLMEFVDAHRNDQWEFVDDEWKKVYYNFYEIGDAIQSFKINYKDGTSEIVGYWDMLNMGNLNFDQGYHDQWTVGTYTVNLEYGAYSTSFEIEIVPSNVEKIEIVGLGTLVEGIDSYVAGEDVDGEYVNYPWYEPTDAFRGLNITYTDGTTEFKDVYEINSYAEYVQDYHNQWIGGNSYPVTIFFGGKSVTFDLVIEEDPVESIEVLSVSDLVEIRDGYLNEEWIDGEHYEYYRYSLWDAVESIRVNYKDGSSEIYSPHNLSGFRLESNQGPLGEIWTAGNSYKCVAYYGTASVEFTVNIIEDPIESIEVYETQPLQEGMNGNWVTTTIHSTGEVIDWYMYSTSDAIVSVKINYKDGTSEIIERRDMIEWGTSSDQYYANQWTVGNTYTATLEYMGYEIEFPVTIIEKQVYEFFVQDGSVIITGWNDYDYAREQVDLVIPDEINGLPVIGINNLCTDAYNTKTVTLPESLVFISDYAFDGYSEVETVYVNGANTNINLYSFEGMYSLKEIVVSEANENYTEIDGVVFNKEVTTIVAYPVAKGDEYVLPETISDLSFMEAYPYIKFIINENSTEFITENGITYNKDKTVIYGGDKTVSGDYVMPDTVESIPAMLFQGCENLTSVKLSSKVTNIAYAMFDNCPNLKSVILPEALISIGDYAFSDCAALENIEFPGKLEYIGERAFINAGLTSINVPDNVTEMGREVFSNTNAVTATVGSGLLYIPMSAFEFSSKLETVTLSEGLEVIDSYAFNNCTALVEINIPDTVMDTGASVFYNCDSLTYLPIGKSMIYINSSMFGNCDGLVDIVIPDQIVFISDSVFSYCSNLKTVVIPESVVEVGNSAFAYCTSLEYIPVGVSQTMISSATFRGCTGLVNVSVPENIEYIGAYAFEDCTSLKNFDLNENIYAVGVGAFRGCTSLSQFTMNNKITEVDIYTFANTGLKEIDLGNTVELIEYQAFANSKLTSVEIPASVVNIAYFAFYNCKDLSSITMPDTLVTLGGHTFENTRWYKDQPNGPVYLGTALYNYKGDIPEGSDREIYIKEGTLSIAGHAFENECNYSHRFENAYEVYSMGGLKAVHMPEGLVEIGEYAFNWCYGLTEVYLPASLEHVLEGAFEGCYNLQTIYYAGTEEQWNAIFGVAGNYTLENCNVVFNYVDEAPEEVTVIVNGEESTISVGEEIVLETEKLTYDATTGKAYVFLDWIVNGADIVESDDGSIKVSITANDASISKNVFVHGNADGDDEGSVNGFDVIAANTNVKGDEYSVYSDVDFDGKITAIDLLDLSRIIKGSYSYEEE